MSKALGIWPVRIEAVRLGERLEQRLGGELFRPWERAEVQKTQFHALFDEYSHWVLIMATGIATRFVGDLMRDKHRDPAVVVLDEAGRYAIPLLGGHEAGANALAYRVANAIGAIPVVTTATEATKPLVVGVGCRKGVEEEQIARAIMHALGRLDLGQLARDAESHAPGNAGWLAQHAESQVAGHSGRVAPHVEAHATCALGAARGATGAWATSGATAFARVRELVTVDLKANEPGLLAFSQRHGIPLRIIARHQIEGRSWLTRPSEWVRQSVGLDGVCEPCALIACGRGKLVVPKTTLDGVAVAVVQDDWGFVS